MNPRNRTLDVLRLVASFGVIAIHCAPTNAAAGFVCDFFLNFCVPFFLLSSLFLFWREVGDGAPDRALRRRLPRLLLPYLSWSVIYLGARVLKLLLTGHDVQPLFSAAQLPALVFGGGAAVQLYFLPLLALGLSLAWVLARVLPRENAARTVVLVSVAALGVMLLLVPTLPAALTDGLAWPEIVRRPLDWLGWLVAPVAIAALLARGLPAWRPPATLGWWLVGAAVLVDVLITARLVPYAWRFHSFVLAVVLVVAAEHLRRPFPAGPLTGLILRSGFGVFLVHHLVLEGIELFAARTGRAWNAPYSLPSLLLVCGVTFVISLAFTVTVSRQRHLSRLLLGA